MTLKRIFIFLVLISLLACSANEKKTTTITPSGNNGSTGGNTSNNEEVSGYILNVYKWNFTVYIYGDSSYFPYQLAFGFTPLTFDGNRYIESGDEVILADSTFIIEEEDNGTSVELDLYVLRSKIAAGFYKIKLYGLQEDEAYGLISDSFPCNGAVPSELCGVHPFGQFSKTFTFSPNIDLKGWDPNKFVQEMTAAVYFPFGHADSIDVSFKITEGVSTAQDLTKLDVIVDDCNSHTVAYSCTYKTGKIFEINNSKTLFGQELLQTVNMASKSEFTKIYLENLLGISQPYGNNNISITKIKLNYNN